ncbi:MAG: hypothetical protein ACXWJS_00645 [Hyphomicrobium sp.]
MTTKEKRAEDRQALEHLLEVYGADRTRWPARERLRFASLVAEDDGARRLVSEASALDSLLDLAPKASAAREHALKERIVAAALRQTEPRFAVVARSAAPARAGWRAWTGRVSALRAPASSGWAAGGLLAASLVVGVLLGSAGTFDTAVQQVAEATGYSVTDTSSHLALGDEMVSASDEEVL